MWVSFLSPQQTPKIPSPKPLNPKPLDAKSVTLEDPGPIQYDADLRRRAAQGCGFRVYSSRRFFPR